MADAPLWLGLDVGTQSTKGLLLDLERGAVVARAASPHAMIEGLPPGAAEQDPAVWIAAVRAVALELLAAPEVDPARVAGVGVSGQQHGLVLLDEAGAVVRPAKLWCDTSTAAEAEELSRELGRAVPAGFTAPKALWVKRNEPERWARTAAVMLPHDYVNRALTGRHATEAGDASGTGWFNVVERRYDLGAAGLIDERLPDMLPELVAPDEPIGELSDTGSTLLGLAAGLPVAVGGGDNMMSAIGSGATRAGVVVVSLGTSGTVFAYSPRPVVDPEGAIAAFCDSTGAWLPLLCVMNMTGVLEELREGLGVALDHATLTREAEEVEPGCGGMLFAPYLVGERVPDLPRATGAIAGIRPGLLRRGALYRAGLEGTSLSLALGVDRMRALGLAPESVRLVGGGARNPLWRQILSDALALPVERLEEPESAALGAALQAAFTARRRAGEPETLDALAARVVRATGERQEPDAARVAVYAEAKARLAELTGRLFG